MSYLNSLRLNFFGQFQAAVSTVNNDPLHFNNATFKPEYQQRQNAHDLNGWWNPRGDANWRMIGCGITSAWHVDGSPAAITDPVFQCSIADSDLTVAAKLVDLDPAQQTVSEIWGLEIRIANSAGETLMRSKYETAAFSDIWTRCPSAGGDGSASAAYQSALTNVEWGKIDASPFLLELQAAAYDRLLSIKFNVDAFDANFKSPTFSLGRIAGSIGPATKSEPSHFVIGRHFMTAAGAQGGFFTPAGQVNFCSAVVDSSSGKIYLDLGNSLATTTVGGDFINLGELSLAYITTDPSNGNQTTNTIGSVDYLAQNWYQKTAGIVVLPADRKLTPAEIDAVASNPLAVLLTDSKGNTVPGILESPNGLYIRADRFVYRLNEGEVANISLHATQYGEPYPNAEVLSYFDNYQIGGGPPVGVPAGALEFPPTLVTDHAGRATLTVKAHDPHNPRGYIDGQVYGIRSVLADTLPPALQYPFNQWEFISFLVWDDFKVEKPVWEGCLQPVFQQYANLYPIMQRFLDLSSYDSICQNIVPLQITFGLGLEDPNSMPVTRDLSASKRKAILAWLTNLQNGRPLKSLGAVVPDARQPASSDMQPLQPTPPDLANSGKLAAIQRVRATHANKLR